MAAQRVTLPWAAWHGDGTHDIELPAAWTLRLLQSRAAPALSDAEIADRLAEPVAAPGLAEVAAGRQTACVVTDDLARPTRMERPLLAVLRALEVAGMPRAGITVVVATGTHPVLSDDDLRRKLGPAITGAYRVASHDAGGDLVESGVTYGDRPLRLNRSFMDAQLRVLVGSVIPHPFAGFSAGAKLVIPGLCDVEATERTHKFVLMGLRGASEVGSNPFRAEIEGIVERIGVHWTVSVIPNAQREPAEIVAGHLIRSHRAACLAAVRVYETPLTETFDCLIANAYPKDVDLVQSQNALAAAQRIAPYPVRQGGVVVMTTAAVRGVGGHGLFAPGGRTYREPTRLRALGDRAIWLYAPTLSEEEARTLHWGGYPFHRSAADMCAELERALGRTATVGIMPAASLQWLDDQRANVKAPAAAG